MVEMIRVLFGALVVASFGAIIVYALVSVTAAASTLIGAVRRDPLADELDQVLAEILGRRGPGRLAGPRRSWRAWRG
jgi:hypothetical protein